MIIIFKYDKQKIKSIKESMEILKGLSNFEESSKLQFSYELLENDLRSITFYLKMKQATLSFAVLLLIGLAFLVASVFFDEPVETYLSIASYVTSIIATLCLMSTVRLIRDKKQRIKIYGLYSIPLVIYVVNIFVAIFF